MTSFRTDLDRTIIWKSCFISDVAWTRLTRNLHCGTSHVVLVILLALALLSESVVARPMYNNGRSRGRSRRGPKPKWVNPCGIDPVMARNHALQMYHDVTPLTDQELIQNILLSAKNALVHSDDFKEKFVSIPVYCRLLHTPVLA